jgi:hypothetical protein
MAIRRTSDTTRSPKPAAAATQTPAKPQSPTRPQSSTKLQSSTKPQSPAKSAKAPASELKPPKASPVTPAAAPAAASAAAKPTPAPRVAKTKATGAGGPQVSEETRRAMIAESAYLRAERRGFAPGHEHEDWCAAEKEVDAMLSANPGAGAQ